MRKIAMPGEASKNLNKPDDVAKLVLNEILTDKVYKGDVLEVGKN
jgi:hypothetical protein